MREETLEYIKDRVSERRNKINEYNRKIRRLRELSKSNEVSEFIELTGKNVDLEYNREDTATTEVEVLKSLSDRIKVEDSNKICVYLNTIIRTYSWIDGEKVDIVVDKDDKRATHKKYYDIERCIEFVIPTRDVLEFESKYDVIYNASVLDVQKDFISRAIATNNDKAKEYVLKKYNK